MSRIITFSQAFPSYHPRAGEPTYFVEKMIEWYWDTTADNPHDVHSMIEELNHGKFTDFELEVFIDALRVDVQEWKLHTLRMGQRFKAGDKFKPCVWSGKPYRSKIIQFLPELEIPKTYAISFYGSTGHVPLFQLMREDYIINTEVEKEIANNDGLSHQDFLDWFPKPFHDGQIICWDKTINY